MHLCSTNLRDCPWGRIPCGAADARGNSLARLAAGRETTPEGKTQVIVVGAGFAGLASAHALRAADIPFVVLEAKDRPGGRARTEYDLVKGHPIEGGAMMVHGSDASVLRWIREVGMTTAKVPEFRGARF